MEAKLVGDLSSVHSVRQILLVGEHEEKGITELVFVKHTLKLLTGLGDTLPIVGIDNENDTLGILVVYVTVRLSVAMPKQKTGVATYNASREDESCPDLQHPTR